MFVKTKNAHKEDILLNLDRVELILRQGDGDVFVYMANGEHIKFNANIFDELCEQVAAVTD